MLKKLKMYRVHGKLLTWIQSFLEARLMKVVVTGSFDWIKLLSGVFQGSTSGPTELLLFFTVYE